MDRVTIADRIVNLLNANPALSYSPLDVAIALQENHNTVRRTIRQLDLGGELSRVGGRYVALQPSTSEVNANA
jgi:DeoR/GlpR family transcriptional regulator of sugar metabolism